MLNNNQLIAVQLLAKGQTGKFISEYLNVAEETISRWKQIDEFKEALDSATENVSRELDETHKNLLIRSQSVINEALINEELDFFKKASLALRYLSLIKGKDDVTQKSSHNLFKHAELGKFKI